MRITRLESGCTIEHDDGTIETVAECPDRYIGYSTRVDDLWTDSTVFLPLKKKTGRKFDTLDDFRALVSLPEYQELSMYPEQWQAFNLYALKRIDRLLRATPSDYPNTANGNDPLDAVVSALSKGLRATWLQIDARLGSVIYDLAGVKRQLKTFHAMEERIEFLRDIRAEMSTACSASLVNFNARRSKSDSTLPARWGIRLSYRHTLDSVDMERLRSLLLDFERSYRDEFAREVGLGPDRQGGQHKDTSRTMQEAEADGADVLRSAASNRGRRVAPKDLQPGTPVPNNDGRLRWTGRQKDLVFLIDRLKEVGLLAPTTTDREIIEHFDFGGTARDMRKNYRNIRLKVNSGALHPEPEPFGRLLTLLLERVQPVPLAEDHEALQASMKGI